MTKASWSVLDKRMRRFNMRILPWGTGIAVFDASGRRVAAGSMFRIRAWAEGYAAGFLAGEDRAHDARDRRP